MNPAFLDDMSWEMAEVYGAISDQILINLAHYFPYFNANNLPASSFAYQAGMLAQMGKVNADTAKIIRNGLADADSALNGVLEAAIIQSIQAVEPDLYKAARLGILKPPVTPILSPNQTRAFQLYYKQAADKLNLVNTVMLESTQQAYQTTVSDIASRVQYLQRAVDIGAGETITGVSSWNQAMTHAINRMKQTGITGFIDHAGKRWSAEAYTAMDIRTTVFNVGRSAVWEVNQDFGNDLYLVSYHNGARPLCYPWQSKVISSTDHARTVVDLDGNEITVYAQSETSYGEPAGLFGINCKHYPTPFIPGVSTIHDHQQSPEANEKTYEESQKQRQLERTLREEKRDLAMLKAQGAPEEVIKAQKARCERADERIEDFCLETGRARHRDREAVYTRRSFPSKDSYDPALFETKQRDMINSFYQNGGTQQGYNFGEMNPKNPPPTQTPPPVVPATPAANVAQQVTQDAGSVVQSAQAAQTPANVVTIATASTKEQLFEAIEKTYNVTIEDGVKALDFKLVQEAMLGVGDIVEQYPEIGEAFKNIKIVSRWIMSCGGSTINFNPDYYTTPGKLQASIDRCTLSHWWPDNTTGRTIGSHEAAHAIEWFLDTHSPAYTTSLERSMAWNDCTEAKAIVSQACKNVKKLAEGKGKKNAELIGSISGYAQHDASETLAESFADFRANGEKAKPLSKEVVRLTTEKYKAYGGQGNGY